MKRRNTRIYGVLLAGDRRDLTLPKALPPQVSCHQAHKPPVNQSQRLLRAPWFGSDESRWAKKLLQVADTQRLYLLGESKPEDYRQVKVK